MRLRVNPATGRLAERIPAEFAYTDGTVADGPKWFTYHFERGAGLQVDLLSEQDVAEWPEVVLAPAPPEPDYHFALACPRCEAHPPTTDVHERDRLATVHTVHDAVRLAVRIHHPHAIPGAPLARFQPGAEVTFHGSAEGDEAGLVEATVQEAAEMPGTDGDMVSGYVVAADGRALFVPATALARH